VHIYWTNL